MGGKSAGSFKINSGKLKFFGFISLENDGGFSSLRGQVSSLDLDKFSGLKLRLRGDGRTYKLTLHSDAVFSPRYPRPVTFQSEFLTTKGQWSEITVPFATLQASFRGRRMEKTFNPKIVKSVGIILADKMQGDFEIDLDWIKAV